MPDQPSYNSVIALGTVTGADPLAGEYFRFGLRCPRQGTETDCDLTCVVEGRGAETAARLIRHGKPLFVHGYLRDGNHKSVELVVTQWHFTAPPARE